ncbi:3-deoxy-D-manno-octulosonic-acid transferase [Anaerobiospirillum thomasii]|nr:3-deoxy-D-manno-octulosonic-acid transferase [Anaerobiospirillum thomasii]
MGEIELYLGLCNIVFMGGSLVDIGGHNPLEPAYFSLPVITGPYYYNFKMQFEDMIDARAAYLANDEKRLYVLLENFINDTELCTRTGLKST